MNSRANHSAKIAGAPKLRVVYVYDSLNRRMSQTVYGWNASTGSWLPASRAALYLYDGASLLAVADNTAAGGPQLVQSYAWGVDLSGSRNRAGGVGGLLMANLNGPTAYSSYDGNGNVIGLVDTGGKVVARYDYDPFGNTVAMTGPLAAANPFRFSTKYADAETGLIYYGARYYQPSMGRWLSREPMGEQESPNLYSLAGNDPVDSFDVNGMYAEAGHFYTTYLVATAAGFSDHDAFQLAYFSQYPDQDWWFSATGAGVLDWDIDRYFHSLTGGDAGSLQTYLGCLITHVTDSTISGMNKLQVQGILIHALGDAYAHARYIAPSPAWSVTSGTHPLNMRTVNFPAKPGGVFLYDAPIGHAFAGTAPDQIITDESKYEDYVSQLYGLLHTTYDGGEEAIALLDTAAEGLTDHGSSEGTYEIGVISGSSEGYDGSSYAEYYRPENTDFYGTTLGGFGTLSFTKEGDLIDLIKNHKTSSGVLLDCGCHP